MEKGPRRSKRRAERFAGGNIYTNFVIFEDEIRILLLEPASTMDAPIVCNFEVASIARKSAYEALSYTWGPPIAGLTLQNEHVRLCGQSMEIKGNLTHALRRLRLPSTRRRLWVDALCINQSDLAERSYQVSIMSQIYRHAKVTQVWLGEDAGDAKIAIAYLHNIYRLRAYLQPLSRVRSHWYNSAANVSKMYDLLLGPNTELGKYIRSTYDYEELRLKWSNAIADHREGSRDAQALDIAYRGPESLVTYQKLLDFFARSYFTRRWVLQELHNARCAEVRCGSEIISWQKMQAASKIHRDNSSARIDSCFASDYPVLWYGVTMRQDRSKGVLRLLQLLDDLREAKCQDPRDIFYALLGLVQHTSLRPDYSLSISETWIAVARAAVREGLAVEVISIAAPQTTDRGRRSGLPSWVPDFQMLNPLRECDQLQFDAFVDAENRLTCSLSCLGEVVYYNGWALIKEKVNNAVIERAIATSVPSTEEIKRIPFREGLNPLLPYVRASSELRDGDLLCMGTTDRQDFAVRAMPVEADCEQEWIVLGDVHIEWQTRTDAIPRSRRLKLI